MDTTRPTIPEQRTLPIPPEHREFTVKSDDTAVGREHQLLGVYITKQVNRISSARLVYLDGAAAASDFPLSGSNLFVPGKRIEILAGPNSGQTTLFKGIVVRQSLKIREGSAPQLIIECRHEAVRLTVGRKNACFLDKADSDIISDLLHQAKISADVETTSVHHKQLVQFRATDWDFLVTRAEANGKFVFTNDGKVTVATPNPGSPVCTLHFGSTILEMDAEIDARLQYAAVKGMTWDPAQQKVVETEGANPEIAGPGNLAAGDLAGVARLDALTLQNGTMTEDEAQAWADATWLKAQMSKATGRIKCEGIGTITPGDTVTLSGVGPRFEGDVYVTGVHHDFDLRQGWKTHIGFGGTDRWFSDEQNVSEPKSGGLLPGVNGLQIGVVLSNEDPDGEYRVQVRMPLIDDSEGTWARVALPDAGNNRGLFYRPEVGDEVVIGFLNDDPRQGVILGMLHSSKNAAPLEPKDDNHEKGYVSRSEMKLVFNDEKKTMTLETPGGNSILLSDEDKGITLADQSGNKIVMDQQGITIESTKALTVKAATALALQPGTSFAISGATEMKMEASGSMELSSSGTVTIKGAMVKIN